LENPFEENAAEKPIFQIITALAPIVKRFLQTRRFFRIICGAHRAKADTRQV
jgi:hypothetical protein